MTTRCPHETDVAPWVLGALDDETSTWFAAHLEACDVCPPQIAELQGVADALPLAATPVSPPPELRDRIMRTVRAEAELLAAAGPEADRPPAPASERRRRRWSFLPRPQLAAGLASVLLLAGVGAAVLTSRDDEVRAVEADVTLREPRDARATVLVEDDGQAELQVQGMPAPPRGRIYQVWVQRKGEEAPRPTDALFQTHDGHATVTVPGGTKGVAAILVTHEPDGGSRTPTSVPAIVARLA